MLRRVPYLVICIMVFICLLGCQWEPPHDNIFDPDHSNYKPFGNLDLRVLTFGVPPQPVASATVLIPELGRIQTVNINGLASFKELSEGTWWVCAYRDIIPDTVYARDSIQVEIRQTFTTDINLQLGALPVFRYAKVISEKRQLADRSAYPDSIELKAVLTAEVWDPDGEREIKHVVWRLQDLMLDTLQFRTDYSYWFLDVPSSSFPGNDLAYSINLPYSFEAYDSRGNSSKATAHLVRVIQIIPERMTANFPNEPKVRPKLSWILYWRDIFGRTEEFTCLLRIFLHEDLVYERYIPNDGNFTQYEHTVEKSLIQGQQYIWEVWVIDNLENKSRSERDLFIVPLPEPL